MAKAKSKKTKQPPLTARQRSLIEQAHNDALARRVSELALAAGAAPRKRDLIAIKHTAAVHVTNSLSLLQRKAANVLLKYAYRDLSLREIIR